MSSCCDVFCDKYQGKTMYLCVSEVYMCIKFQITSLLTKQKKNEEKKDAGEIFPQRLF